MIVIEGLIGAGKTTLGHVLSKEFNIPFYSELNNEFTLFMLDKFYKDKSRWAFSVQINFLNERFKLIKAIFKTKGGILDRSIYGDRVFASLLNESGYISNAECRIYFDLLDNMLEHSQRPVLMIYLDCSVDEAERRIKNRNRSFETGIPREYLEGLNEKYLSWYDSYNLSPKLKFDYDSMDIFDDEHKSKLIAFIKEKLVI
ncbi:deoxynucleoside kinase [Borrelia hermsii]|uniref:Deoxyguanosine kinase n=2 Tax=Borrelia hermsii TaxID=140 RepID=A0AAN0X6L5_BORHE|nr:deoxynucleoside kinase [Borrelia hermsii]AJW73054.1 deoxyguanosine kinase [Borrelia hermsii CC1]AMR75832.1 Deoxyguanosine kinase [Borrelia hermsii]ANA43052.1 deoxyguanosine kinase [Borrelia hermsii HS1]UCP01848.1 deoxynucleoside kinase [Borrelia hermsii]UEQ06890.1 deoxynucleoside kinase [Borrelia hermsii]